MLGRPALVCRWRLASRALPLENRHLRALGRRSVGGAPVSPQLIAWAKQHIEWTLSEGAARNPDGVLMVIVDEGGRGMRRPRRASRPRASGWCAATSSFAGGRPSGPFPEPTRSFATSLGPQGCRSPARRVSRAGPWTGRLALTRRFSFPTSTAWSPRPRPPGRAPSGLPTATRACSSRSVGGIAGRRAGPLGYKEGTPTGAHTRRSP